MSVVAKPLIDLNRFGMNGYKILKCFRKKKRVSGELPCPATGLIISVLYVQSIRELQ